MNTCELCKHYKPEPNQKGQGACLRYPPVVAGFQQAEDMMGRRVNIPISSFPPVAADRTCGEFSRKLEICDG